LALKILEIYKVRQRRTHAAIKLEIPFNVNLYKINTNDTAITGQYCLLWRPPASKSAAATQSLAARQLELRCRFCSRICLRQSSQLLRHASLTIAIQSKKLHGVGCNSRGQLYHSHSPPESREDTKTMSRPLVVPVAIHCQQMEPLLAVCLFPGLSHSSLS